MNRTHIAVLACGVIAAFVFGVLVGRQTASPATGAGEAVEQSIATARPSASSQREGHAFQAFRGEDAERPEGDVIEGFAFRRAFLDTSGELPKACFQFTEDLDAAGEVNYGDYLRLTPDADSAVMVEGSTLCVAGLEFDADYSATLRAGLPSASGATLEQAERVAVAFGDKPAYVGFAGDGVVLPRLDADGLGVKTVNVEAVKLEVYRVSDRALARKEIVAGEASGENDYSYVWERNDGADVGVKVFEDKINTPGERNETKTTVFALGAALKTLQPGTYFVRVTDASDGAGEARAATAWRWIVFTDMALTTFSSNAGVDVFVRSLDSAKPLSGVSLSLVAENNDLLGEAVTNANGRARFEAAMVNGDYPLTPKAIMAYGPQNDFATIDLTRAPLDLSDRKVGGRDAPAGVDGYLYFDRGVYRPGETAHVTALMRDASGRAIASRPATANIHRPNGVIAETRRIEALNVGAMQFDYDVPTSAPRGQWRIEVTLDGESAPAASGSFAVEDFVPQRLAVALRVEKTPIRPGDTRAIGVESRYLYGAPAGGLPVEGEARLRLDPNPFPDFSGFRFGPVDGRFNEQFIKLPNTTTDAGGVAELALDVSEARKGYGAPMRADLVVGVVEPGGRVVRESTRIPVRPGDYYVGLKLADGKRGFGLDETVAIETALLDWRGDVADGEIEWKLYEQDYWFDWYRVDGEWRWRRSWRDNLVAEGRAKTGSDALGSLVGQRLDHGSYRLTATRAGGKETSAIRFYVGWRSYEAGVDSPDQAQLTVQNEKLAPGARARLVLTAPYEGEAIVAVATDRVHSVQRVRVDGAGKEIVIDTDPAWGAGFYVLASVATSRDPGERPTPRRAMAVTHVPFEMSARRLDVSVEAPEIVRPRQQLELPVTIAGAHAGETVMMTLAAVDEGILRLTKFASPDPVKHYFGKKRLAVSVRDDYGRLLNANLGAPARFGGDQLGGEGLTVVPIKSVALFEGPVSLDGSGLATIPLEIPDFNGELRLMAVAWSAGKLGSKSAPLTVRDAVPAVLSMPRFTAPGDTATATLLIDNVEGPPGDYAVSLAGAAPFDMDARRVFTLAQGEQASAEFPFTATAVGVGEIALSVEGPDGFSVARSYPIQSRTPYFPVSEIKTAPLDPGETFTVSSAVFEGFVEGSGEASVSFSRIRGIEPGPLLESLYRYPWGCTEQLVSSAYPLLFVDVLGGELDREPERAVRPRVQKAVNTLLNRQSPDGAFGLWRVGDRYADAWLAPYVTDFLYRARAENYAVPQPALDAAYASLKEITRLDRWYAAGYQTRVEPWEGSNDTTEHLRRRASAYALYVLARAGRGDISDLRYFHDTLLEETPSPLARAHIGAALAIMGDRARALNAFKMAFEAFGWNNRGDYYQSPLRDAAGVVALAAETNLGEDLETITDGLLTFIKDPDAMHTQEKAYVLFAAQALLRAGEEVVLSRNGERLQDLPAAPVFTPNLASLSESIAFTNQGEGRIYRSLTVSGSPLAAPAPTAQGLTISKRVATRDGQAVDLASIRQNDRLVVVLTGRAQDARTHPAIIADLLPAGFEIESVLRPQDGANASVNGPYKWIGEIDRPKIAEARDDRFVAAVDIRGTERFTLAYVVRAVTPGDYAMPGVVIEDMYRPGVFARTAKTDLKIGPAP
ncbi:MAG: alpha-2-macroglobulin [Pseudomonadota bacterium]